MVRTGNFRAWNITGEGQNVHLSGKLPGSILKTAMFDHIFTILLRFIAATLPLPLVQVPRDYGVDLLGPTRSDYHWQLQAGQGFAAGDFQIDWHPRKRPVPRGKRV